MTKQQDDNQENKCCHMSSILFGDIMVPKIEPRLHLPFGHRILYKEYYLMGMLL